MPIAASDMLFCLSGGASNTSTALSLGGSKSNTTITDGTLNNLWDDVSVAEASAGDVEYRGFFVMNSHSTLTLSSSRVWIYSSTSASGDEIAITTDSANTNSNNSMSSCSNESSAPAGAGTWVTQGTVVSLGDIGPTKSWGIWVRRSVSAGASGFPSNSAMIAWDGITP